ncbi:MAG: ImmA/IrrE family metallo-endopeptidase, partial [Pseudomonadales bacterium]
IDVAAQKLQIKDGKQASAEEKLFAYESGSKELSRAMLTRMSKLYRRPLLTFYLDTPPNKGDRGEDFRTLPDHFEAEENVYVDVLIRDIKARQSTIREALIDEDEATPLTFIGKNTADQGVRSVVQTIREVFDINIEEYRNQANQKEAFKFLRQRAEKAGIFVLLKGNLGSHHTNIDVKVFRGFALSDNIAPFIVINDRDARSAWSFTLLHEMAHLALGQTGVSGAFAEKKIEKFCNQVASEFLLSSKEFANFQPTSLDIETIRDEISDYAALLKISSSHVSYRLFRRGDIDKKLWVDLRDFYYQQWQSQRNIEREKNRKQGGGPNPYVVGRYKLGALASLVQRLTFSGALTTTKAGMLLDVRPLKVHRIFDNSQLA